jgi:hypothetical protein
MIQRFHSRTVFASPLWLLSTLQLHVKVPYQREAENFQGFVPLTRRFLDYRIAHRTLQACPSSFFPDIQEHRAYVQQFFSLSSRRMSRQLASSRPDLPGPVCSASYSVVHLKQTYRLFRQPQGTGCTTHRTFTPHSCVAAVAKTRSR